MLILDLVSTCKGLLQVAGSVQGWTTHQAAQPTSRAKMESPTRTVAPGTLCRLTATPAQWPACQPAHPADEHRRLDIFQRFNACLRTVNAHMQC